MSIKIFCECGGKFKINAEMFGKRVQCPSCGQVLMAFAAGDQGDSEGGGEKPTAADVSSDKVAQGGRKNTLVWGGIGAFAVAAVVIACYFLIVGNPFGQEKGPDEKKAAPSVAGTKRSTGVVDAVDAGHITGWAWDPEQPNTPINVDVYDNDSLLVTLPADQFRKDLAKFAGNGKHRFFYVIPRKMRDDKEHVFRVKISGTNIELKNSPKTVTLKKK
jgi:hypothetical protein